MWDVGLLILILLATVACGFLWWEDRRHAQMDEIRVQKMRNGSMYAMLYPMVKKCRKRYVEQVSISRHGIMIGLISPPSAHVEFDFEEKGFYALTPEQLRALCLILEKDLEVLMNKSRYRFERKVIAKPNGDKETVYFYTIKSGYKAAINRAPFYAA